MDKILKTTCHKYEMDVDLSQNRDRALLSKYVCVEFIWNQLSMVISIQSHVTVFLVGFSSILQYDIYLINNICMCYFHLNQNYQSISVHIAHKNLLNKFLVKIFSIFTSFF